MAGFAANVARILPSGSGELLLGTVVGADVDDGTLTVNVAGLYYDDLQVTDAGCSPTAGDPVLLLRQGDWMVVIGAVTTWLPPHGTVTATGATTLDVSVPGHGTVTLPFLKSYASPTIGDAVAIAWHGTSRRGVIVGELSTAPTSPSGSVPVPPAPPSTPVSGMTTFPARAVGTYRSGEWRTDDNGDVIQGTPPSGGGANEGAWFYGGSPRSTLAGATVTSASIYLGRTSGGVYAAQACHLQRVTDDNRPAGALTFVGSVDNVSLTVGQEGWFPLATAIAQDIVTSGGSVGISAPSGPYMRMYGLSKSGSAGALRIAWER